MYLVSILTPSYVFFSCKRNYSKNTILVSIYWDKFENLGNSLYYANGSAAYPKHFEH